MEIIENEQSLKRSELYLSTEYQSPEREAEMIMADIWGRVLNVDKIGVQDDFFEIGGDSLAATILASEVERSLHCKFSPSNLVEYSTIANQLIFIEGQKGQAPLNVPSNMTPFNLNGKKPPIFLIHGAIGYTLYDKRFLENLDKDQPVIFIEAPGLDGKELPLEKIESFAEHYLNGMRQVTPEGDWLLAANCAGGLVAMEICRQAELAGERVARLMLIDPMSKVFKTRLHVNWLRVKRKYRLSLPKKFRLKKKGWWSALQMRLQNNSEIVGFEASLDMRQKKQSRSEQRVHMRLVENADELVPSQIAYNADAMRNVSRKFSDAVFEHVSSIWEGPTYVLRSLDNCGDFKVMDTYLPNAKIRITSYPHKFLFTDGLKDLTKFLEDVASSDAEERF